MATTTTVRTISALLATALTVAPGRQALAWQPEDEGDATEEGAEGEAAPEEEAVEGEAAPEGEAGEEEAGEEEVGEEEAGEEEVAEEEPAPEEEAAAEEPEVEPPPPTPTGPQRPDEPRIGGRPAKGVGLMATGGVLLGLGAAGLITTSLVTRKCSFDGPLQCKYRDQDEFLIPLTAAPTILGVVLLAVGAGYYVRYNKWEKWTPGKNAMVAPILGRNGGGVAVSGRF